MPHFSPQAPNYVILRQAPLMAIGSYDRSKHFAMAHPQFNANNNPVQSAGPAETRIVASSFSLPSLLTCSITPEEATPSIRERVDFDAGPRKWGASLFAVVRTFLLFLIAGLLGGLAQAVTTPTPGLAYCLASKNSGNMIRQNNLFYNVAVSDGGWTGWGPDSWSFIPYGSYFQIQCQYGNVVLGCITGTIPTVYTQQPLTPPPDGQLWSLVNEGGGYVAIVNKLNGNAITLVSPSPYRSSDTSALTTAPYTGADYQQYFIEEFRISPMQIIAVAPVFDNQASKRFVLCANAPMGPSVGGTLAGSGSSTPITFSYAQTLWQQYYYTYTDTSFATASGTYTVSAPGFPSSNFLVSGSAYRAIPNDFGGTYGIPDLMSGVMAFNREPTPISPWTVQVVSFSGTTQIETTTGTSNQDLHGGWRDATSVDKEAGNESVAVRDLAYAAEDAVNASDRALLLTELSYGVDYLLRLQNADGSFPFHVDSQPDSAFSLIWANTDIYYNAEAAMGLAAAARVLSATNPQMSGSALQAAEKAWTWTVNNPTSIITGFSYYMMSSQDSILGAALELAVTTGDPAYTAAASALFYEGHFSSPSLEGVSAWTKASGGSYPHQWMGANAAIGLARYARSPQAWGQFKQDILAQLTVCFNYTARTTTPFGTGTTQFSPTWGECEAQIGPTDVFLNSYLAVGNPQMLTAAQDDWNWLLGANPFGSSFVIGFGAHNVIPPFYRPRPGSIGETPPGILLTSDSTSLCTYNQICTTWGMCEGSLGGATGFTSLLMLMDRRVQTAAAQFNVTITSPANGATLPSGTSVAIAATATNSTNAIQKVDFYGNGALLATATSAPYTCTWASLPSGAAEITAVATDSAGLYTTASVDVNPSLLNPDRWTGASSSAWDTTTANWSGNATTFSNGDSVLFDDTSSNPVVSIANGITVQNATFNSTAQSYSLSGTLACSGTVVQSGSGAVNFGATLTGLGGITVNSGTLALSTTNTYTGPTTVNGGVLKLNNASGLPSASLLTVNSGGALDICNTSPGWQTVINLNGGSFINSGTTGQIVYTTIAATSGTIASGLGGQITLNKTTSGTLVITAGLSCGGNTTVNGGVLDLAGSTYMKVVVNSGTFVQPGQLISSILTINSGGVYGPVSGPSFRNFGGTGGGLVLNPGGTMQFLINGSTAGTQYDQVRPCTSSSVSLGGNLVLTATSTLPVGGVYTLINNSNSSNTTLTGAFALLPEGTQFYQSNQWWQISYVGGTSHHDVTVTRIAAPSPAAVPAITSGTSINGTKGSAFSYLATASNSPMSFAALGLPSGLSIATSTGFISGTPTVTGTFLATVSANNIVGTGSAPLTITLPLLPVPAITSSLNITGTSGSAFSYQTAASNSPTGFGAVGAQSGLGEDPVTGLPSGLSMNPSTGLISGTPLASGTYSVVIGASNASGTGGATLAITVLPPPPVITSLLSVTGSHGCALSYQIAASNSPTSYGASGLPGGLSVNPGTGLISGTPTVTGSFGVTISGSNADGAGTATLTINVLPSPPVITSPTGIAAISGSAFSYQITASNSPTSFAASNLPSNLSVSASTGLISGTPTTVGGFSPTISASNADGTASATLAINILASGPKTWTGATSGTWDTVTANWTGAATKFVNNDSVIFDDTALKTTVAIAPSITASNVIFSSTSQSYSLSGTLACNGSLVQNSPGAVNLGVALSGTGGVTVNSGTLILSGTNTYKGPTIVNGGVLQVGNASCLPSASVLTLNSGGALDINNNSPWLTLINLNGGSIVNSGTAGQFLYTTINATSGTIASGMGGTITLNKTTSGTLVYSAQTSCGGTINVNGGTLYLTGATQMNVVVNSGTFVQIGVAGNGSTVTINSGGVYGPASAPSFRAFSWGASNFVLNSGATMQMLITGTIPGYQYDQVVQATSGSVTLSGSLSLLAPCQLPAGGVYTLINNSGNSNPVNGTFSGLPEGAQFYQSNQWWQISYVGGSGNDVTVTRLALSTPGITSALSVTGTNGCAFSYQTVAANNPTGYGASGLPDGLSISASSGLISGTPTVTGTFWPVVSASNFFGTGTATLIINLLLPPPVVSIASITGTNGCAFNYQIAASNSPTGYATSDLPSGLSADPGTGLISGTPTVTGTFSVTISASNGQGTGSANLTINLLPPPIPVITSPLGVTGSYGTAFSYQITATNGPSGYWASGLPTGLSVSASTGLISGTPTVAGVFYATISASNPGGTGTAALTINLLPPPAPAITSPLSVTGTLGSAFSYQITASNSPTSYGASGLPTGMSVSASTGLISGTPTVTGTFNNVTLSAINLGGTGTATLTITLPSQPVPVISGTLNVTGTNGKAFSYQITASNSPTSYAATGLPAGLTVSASTGLISGTPTVTGYFTPTISASNPGGTGIATLILTVIGLLPNGSFESPNLGSLSWNAWTYTPVDTTGTNPIYWTFSGSSGIARHGSRPSGNGSPNPPDGHNTAFLEIVSGSTGGSFSQAVNFSSPGSYSLSFQAALDPDSGMNVRISFNVLVDGTALASGTYSPPSANYTTYTTSRFSINSSGTHTVKFAAFATSGTVADSIALVDLVTLLPQLPAPAITSATSVSGTNGSAFNYQIAASNTPTSYGASGLPTGLSLSASTGLISGTPTLTGSFNATISATNASGTGSATLAINVLPPPPTITSAWSATGIYGSAFSYQITASNSPTSFAASELPAGLSVSASTGLISGTPTVAGTFYPTISASNPGGNGGATLTISINTPYNFWRSTHFSVAELLNAATSGDTACPAGDGISNLTKYALNLDPHVAGVSGMPVLGVTGTGNSRYLTLTYTENLLAIDIDYVVEASSDLVNWSGDGITTTPVNGSLSADGLTQKLLSQDSTPMTGATKRFLRLKVTLP